MRESMGGCNSEGASASMSDYNSGECINKWLQQ